ncbi:MAG: nuclear transport factor 2 family protein [Oscillospiraceae bacterium]|nr:nuclear transport factor 2 family protein [Oscillospiraceae bacterium]
MQMITEFDSNSKYDFSVFENVELINVKLSELTIEQLEVLYQQAKYCQAMTEADTDTLREMVPEDAVFTHMSGKQQSREEYFADIENGNLKYFKIGIDSPVVEADGDSGTITYTSVLNANAYGTKGVFRMSGTHRFVKRDGKWFTDN